MSAPGAVQTAAEVDAGTVFVRCDAHLGPMRRDLVEVVTFDVSVGNRHDMMIGYACRDFRGCLKAARAAGIYLP